VAAGSRRQCQCRGDPAHQAGERGLGARPGGRRAVRAHLQRSSLRLLMPFAAMQREQDILTLWDLAAGRPRRQRDDALFTAAGAPPTASIGAGNAALLALRTRLFGATWRLRAACPVCRTDCEFAADSATLAAGLVPVAATAPPRIA